MILLTAATPWERKPLQARWGLRNGGPVAGCYRGKVSGRDVALLETGMGPLRTAEALERFERAEPSAPPELVIGSGLAGALQPELRSGELVADLREAPLDLLQAARQTAGELGMPFHLGSFHSADRVLARPEEKREAGARLRAIAVDMESAAIREWSRKRGAVFAGVRAVLDGLDQRLPADAPSDDSAAEAARYMAGHLSDLPTLLGLWLGQRRGMKALGRFLEAWIGRL